MSRAVARSTSLRALDEFRQIALFPAPLGKVGAHRDVDFLLASSQWLPRPQPRHPARFAQPAHSPAAPEPAPAKAGDIDERVNAFLDRPLDGEWPYLWLDATSLNATPSMPPPSRGAPAAASSRWRR
jgi:hypothetical protein